MFGRDLGLPIPRPYLVRIEPEFAATLPDAELRRLLEASLDWNFGSALRVNMSETADPWEISEQGEMG